MKKTIAGIFALLITCSTTALAVEGLAVTKSPYSATETMSRLVENVQGRGLKVFAKIDHAAGAATVGKQLRPTEVLVFGSPKGGTPLLECAQTAGIDLPLRALVWEDAAGQVWIGYDKPDYIAQRHSAGKCFSSEALEKVMAGLAAATVAP